MRKYIVTSICTLALTLSGALGFTSNAMADLNSSNLNKCTTRVVQSVTNVGTQNTTPSSACPKNLAANALSNGQVLTYKNIDLSNCKSVSDVVKTLQANGCKNINSKNIKKNKALCKILSTVKKNCAAAKRNNTNTTNTVPTPTAKPVATPQPTPTAEASNNSGLSSYASQVLQLVNEERAKAGLPGLTTNSALSAAANKRAQEIKQSFSHTRPDGSSCFTVLPEYNVSYSAAGENIAYGQRTPQEVVTGWMNSPGHRANILNTKFGKIGIGVYQSNGVYYWTQEFTN